jgi:hypothetical protein
MKTLKKILLFLTGIGLLIACSKSDHFWGDEPLGNTMKNGKAEPVMVTTPFKTTFNYIYKGIYKDLDHCGLETPDRVLADGTGSAIHLGNFTTHVDFCCNMVTGVFGIQGSTVGSFVSANGDELFYATWGLVNPRDENDPPYIINKWNAPFLFIGGTGRFDGASGKGFYKGYNYLDNDSPVGLACHAIFEGTLTMVKGKQ